MSNRFEYVCEKYDFIYHICIKDHKFKCSYSPNLCFDMEKLVSILNEQDQRLNDLEEQLAESEKRLVNCVDFDTWQKTAKENQQLKQLIAKKDKEIDERMMAFEKRCQEYYKSKEFTIEQLEKAKKVVNKTDKNGYLIRFANLDERLKFYKEIDQLITEIKGE